MKFKMICNIKECAVILLILSYYIYFNSEHIYVIPKGDMDSSLLEL